MNNNLTEVVFILDRSGSMCGLVNDTIGGFNSFIEKQKQEVGEAKLTTVLFDNEYEILHNGIDINHIELLTNKEYYVRGTTALLDAIGKTINEVGNRLSKTNEEDRPSKIVFVITTDGAENASEEFTASQVKEMIEHQQNKYNWQFIFLGANIDAISTGTSLGIRHDRTINYTASEIGTESVYYSISNVVSGLRGCQGPVGDSGEEGITNCLKDVK